MRVKAGRKAETYAKIQKARMRIKVVKEGLEVVRAKLDESDGMAKSCATKLAAIQRCLATITKDNLVSTPKVTRKKVKTVERKGKRAKAEGWVPRVIL